MNILNYVHANNDKNKTKKTKIHDDEYVISNIVNNNKVYIYLKENLYKI